MMDYHLYHEVSDSGAADFFSWLLYLLIVVVLIMSIAALWKYINKK